MIFKPTYLYIKIHEKTGKKYFGKTILEDPFAYKGSGTYWTKHLNKHGNDFRTIIYGFYTDEEECKRDAIEFSRNNNIVGSKEWANQVEETGLDGFNTTGIAPAKHSISNEYIGMVSCDDLRWQTGEIVGAAKGKVITDEQRQSMSDVRKGKNYFVDSDKNLIWTSCDDPRVISGELVGFRIGTAPAKDPITGKMMGAISTDDPRWQTGEIVGRNKGVSIMSDASKKKLSDKFKRSIIIHDPITKKNKRAWKGEEIPAGWLRGRCSRV